MEVDDLRDRHDHLTAALADIESGAVQATRAERAYLAGSRDTLSALLAETDPAQE
jgi:hypothetical protein